MRRTTLDRLDSSVESAARIAIIMSAPWRAGMLRNARLLARHFVEQQQNVEVVIGVRKDGPYDWAALETEIATIPRTTLRRFHWASIDPHDAARIYDFPVPDTPHLMAPRDGKFDFLDCDGWIVFSNSLEGFVVPSRPIGVFCADLIQRYVPEIFGGLEAKGLWALQDETFKSWRRSRFVFSTTPATRQDVIEYAGVVPERAILTPTFIDPLAGGQLAPDTGLVPDKPYILWVTNASPHKNARGALAALKVYYETLGGNLDVVICGQDTEKLNPAADNRAAIASEFARESEVLKHLRFLGEVSDETYAALVERASVIWHNVITDNGTFVAFDAARTGRYFVSSDYPQMRYLCERYGVDTTFHPHDDAEKAAAALLAADRKAQSGTAPSHKLVGDDPGEKGRAYHGLLARILEPQRQIAHADAR